jgi:hypothetical protein
VRKDVAVSIEPLFESSSNEGATSAAAAGDGTDNNDAVGIRVALASGAVLTARTAVVAAARCAPVVPAWARAAGAADADGASVRPGAAVDLPARAAAGALAGRRVAVVGGGAAAAALGTGAAAAGARVTLLARRPLRRAAWEADVGWWGPKRLAGFSSTADPRARLLLARRARPAASLDAPAWAALAAAAAGAGGAGGLEVLEGVEVFECARAASGRWALCLRPARGLPAGEAREAEAAAAGALTAFRRALGDTPDEPVPRDLGLPLAVDEVWLACGGAYDASSDPLLAPLRAAAPTRFVAGYPLLDEATLLWPGAPVFFLGRAARLALGPAAGGSAGARAGAERAAAALRRLDHAATRPEWAAAVARLAPQFQLLSEAASAANTNITDSAALAPEAAGRPFAEAPPTRPSLRAPPGLVDVSDLPANLPRRSVQQYAFANDASFWLEVSFEVPEAVQAAAVRTLVAPRSLEVWAVGAGAAWRLHAPLLYGRVLPERTRVRARVGAGGGATRVVVALHKETGVEWRFLRGAPA